jgi:hypothetical protein
MDTDKNAMRQTWRMVAITAIGLLAALGVVLLFVLYIGDTRSHREASPMCAEYEDVCSDACRTENFGGNCLECCSRATAECNGGRDFEQVLKECRRHASGTAH